MNRFVFALLLLASSMGTLAHAAENLIFNSVEDSRQYYQKLIHAVRSGKTVHLEAFNHLFAPADPAPPPSGEGFTRCMDQSKSGDCQPLTYYSWGGVEKLENIKKFTPDREKWTHGLNLRYTLWLVPSSISTYTYGRIPIRFHFKHSKAELYPMPAYTMWDHQSLLDWYFLYNLEGNAWIESVSYGLPEQWDEMAIEIQRRLDPTQPWKDVRLYNPYASYGRGTDTLKIRLVHGSVQEREIQVGESEMIENLTEFLETVLDERGWLHTQKCAGCEASHHFVADWPTFFDPK